jgi:hypothetical protein
MAGSSPKLLLLADSGHGASCEVGKMMRWRRDSVLLLTQDGEATWWWGSERLGGSVLELIHGVLWPRRGGVEGGFGCGEVWGLH